MMLRTGDGITDSNHSASRYFSFNKIKILSHFFVILQRDLTKLITSDKEKISINVDVNFDEESLSKTTIKKLIDTKFEGEIS